MKANPVVVGASLGLVAVAILLLVVGGPLVVSIVLAVAAVLLPLFFRPDHYPTE